MSRKNAPARCPCGREMRSREHDAYCNPCLVAMARHARVTTVAIPGAGTLSLLMLDGRFAGVASADNGGVALSLSRWVTAGRALPAARA